MKKIILSGLVEVEANYENRNVNLISEEDTQSSDIVLAAVEIGMDMEIASYISGFILHKWEEDKTEPIEIDAGFIIIGNEDSYPFYFHGGENGYTFWAV